MAKHINQEVLANTEVESVSMSELKSMLDRNILKGSDPYSLNLNGNILQFRVVNMNPSLANALLQRNQQNRPLRTAQVLKYANSIEKGEWNFDATPINFDKYGSLLNGQHRLSAVVKSGITIPILVATGFSPKIFSTMDVGRNRSLSEILAIAGIDNHALCASSADFIYRMEEGIFGRKKSNKKGVSNAISNDEVLKFVQSNPLIGQCVKYYDTMRKERKVPMVILPSDIVVGLFYLFSQKSEDDAKLFFNKLLIGEGLEIDSPIFHLRNRLVNAKVDRKNSVNRLYKSEMVRITINGWNKFRNKEKIKSLKVPEQMPKII